MDEHHRHWTPLSLVSNYPSVIDLFTTAVKESEMKDTDKVAHRLALLEGVTLSAADLEFITN
jgi:hypothetical protein